MHRPRPGDHPEILALSSPRVLGLGTVWGQRERLLRPTCRSEGQHEGLCCGDSPAFRAVFSEDQVPASPQSISPLACPPASPSPHGSSRELTCCFDNSWEERVGDGEGGGTGRCHVTEAERDLRGDVSVRTVTCDVARFAPGWGLFCSFTWKPPWKPVGL